MIAKKSNVQIITNRNQPQYVAKQSRNKPWLTDENAVEEQLDKMQNYQKWEKGTGMEKEINIITGDMGTFLKIVYT